MKNLLGKIALVALLSVLSFGDDMQDARDAYAKKDYQTAFRLYNSACDNGNARGRLMVGLEYKIGKIVKKNNQLAIEYFSKACDMGIADGCKWATDIQNNIPVCAEDELFFANDKRYFKLGRSVIQASILADSNTIKIDKKNKIIKVWVMFLANKAGRQSMIESLGKNNDYSSYGYGQSLVIIDYGNMKNKLNSGSDYNCDGSIIVSSSVNDTWDDIVPTVKGKGDRLLFIEYNSYRI